jgi:hypothetical protein
MSLEQVYSYLDERGRFVFAVERYAPKRFRTVLPNGLECEPAPRRVLYGLPDLLDRSRRSETVYVVEGEKDVESMRKLGLIAVTNPGGTHHGWHDTYSRALRGRNVVILPDCDKPGHDHAAAVEASLRGKASSVVTVRLPGLRTPQDVSDWLGSGGTKEMLSTLVATERFKIGGLGARLKGAAAKQKLIFQSRATTSQKLLLLALWHRTRDQTPIPKVHARQLAFDTTMHRVTVQRNLDKLKLAGVIRRSGPSQWSFAWDVLAALCNGSVAA